MFPDGTKLHVRLSSPRNINFFNMEFGSARRVINFVRSAGNVTRRRAP